MLARLVESGEGQRARHRLEAFAVDEVVPHRLLRVLAAVVGFELLLDGLELGRDLGPEARLDDLVHAVVVAVVMR